MDARADWAFICHKTHSPSIEWYHSIESGWHMKRNLIFWQTIGIVIVSALGVLLHFLYDWTHNTVISLFSAVNESTWEHMKLFFFPTLLFLIVQRMRFGKRYPNFWYVKLKSTLLGLFLIPVLFYTLNGMFGATPDWMNIAIFFASVIAAFMYETRRFKEDTPSYRFSPMAICILCLIAISFGIFTYFTPKLPLFRSPTDGSYGRCTVKEVYIPNGYSSGVASPPTL